MYVMREMAARGMSQCHLARRAGLDRRRIQRWLSGARSLRVCDLPPILAVLGIELRGGEERRGLRSERVRIDGLKADPSNAGRDGR